MHVAIPIQFGLCILGVPLHMVSVVMGESTIFWFLGDHSWFGEGNWCVGCGLIALPLCELIKCRLRGCQVRHTQACVASHKCSTGESSFSECSFSSVHEIIVQYTAWKDRIRSHKVKLKKKKLNSMVWVRERTIPTERPPLVGEISASRCG
jgi:hypothetical protein